MKILAAGLLLVSLVGLIPASAQAGAATDAALGLGAFAVFNQLFGGYGYFGYRPPVAYVEPYYGYSPRYHPPVVYAPPAVTSYYSSAPAVTYASPAPVPPRAQSELPPSRAPVAAGDAIVTAARSPLACGSTSGSR